MGGGLFHCVDNNSWTQHSMSVREQKEIQAARDIAGPSASISFSKLNELNYSIHFL
jgi:hypothetical protein